MMPKSASESASQRRRWGFPPALVSLGLIAYVGWILEPVLQYQALQPVFFAERAFFREYIGLPGGLVEYLASFLLQFYLYQWLGALITTAVAVLLYRATRSWLEVMRGPDWPWLPWVPALLWLSLQAQYRFPWMTLGVGVLVTLGAAIGYARLPLQSAASRGLCFLALSLGVYWLTAGSYLLWAWLAGGFEGLVRRRWRLGLGYGIGGLAWPWLMATLVFVLPTIDAYTLVTPWLRQQKPPALAAALYGYFVLVGVMLALVEFLGLREAGPSPLKIPSFAVVLQRWTNGSSWKNALQPGAFWAAAGLGLWVTFDPDLKAKIQVDFFAQQQNWLEVLRLAPRLKTDDPEIISDINRALCRTGRMASEMFGYPQRKGNELWLFLHRTLPTSKTLKASDLLFELGQINRSERLAVEAMELTGYRPAILQRLALVNVLKGEPEAARLFLRRLRLTLFYRDWSEQVLRELAMDPALSRFPGINAVRENLVTQDYVGNYESEALLLQCLRANRKNRMALEYLMAHYLLQGELEKMMQNLPRLAEFSLSEIPRHYEEAILLYQKTTGQTPSLLEGWKVRPQTVERFQRFHQQFMSYQNNLAAAQAGLAREFGDTYWFYYMFDQSGSLASRAVPGKKL